MARVVIMLIIICISLTAQYCKKQTTEEVETNYTSLDSFTNPLLKNDIKINVIDAVYDADGNSYTTIKVGNQVWMADNLRTTTCRDGTPLETIVVGNTSKKGAIYWLKNNAKSTAAKEYGPMYNWAAIVDCDICPKDFKIPTRTEWDKLIRFWYGKNGVEAGAPGLTYASYKLREPGTRLWSQRYKYTDTISAIGFCAKPGGWLEKGELQFYGERTGWWGFKNKLPNVIKIADGDGGVWGADATTDYAMYVRCIKYR